MVRGFRTVRVPLAERPYDVVIGHGVLEGGAPLDGLSGRRVFVASDETVWRCHGRTLEAALGRWNVEVAGRRSMESGEAHKDLASLSGFWDALVEARLERRDVVLAFGGGVVGDVAGFAAATYLRGVDFVQVPTTLLAAVDSSVGGKTAIDHAAGKNLVGAFHQPRGVVVDLRLLATLPRREVLSGLAEVLKAGLLGDPELFALLETRGPGLLEDPEGLEEAVARAVAYKAGVVAADEREGGRRALLNLGHTLGHGVEVAAGFGVYTHGEAVALGLAFAVRLAVRLGRAEPSLDARLNRMLEHWGYPLRIEGLPAEKIREALAHDKKSRGGEPRWVLPSDVGDADWGVQVPEGIVAELLEEVLEGR